MSRLVHQARIYNFSQAVTSVLFYSGQQFVHLLEGEQEAVATIFERIRYDTRHTSIVVLYEKKVPRRLFPHQSLGFRHVDAAALSRLVGFLHPQRRASLLPRSYDAEEMVAELLHDFVAEQVGENPDAEWR